MASQVCENLAFINGDDEVKGMEVFEIDGGFLMSLMEEGPYDVRDNNNDNDDDRLDSIIRSLEAEINTNMMDGPDSMSMESESMSNTEDFTLLRDMGQMDGQDYWGPCDYEVGWVDMDVVPSSPSDQGSWCINPYGDEMEGINAEFFDVGNNLNGYRD